MVVSIRCPHLSVPECKVLERERWPDRMSRYCMGRSHGMSRSWLITRNCVPLDSYGDQPDLSKELRMGSEIQTAQMLLTRWQCKFDSQKRIGGRWLHLHEDVVEQSCASAKAFAIQLFNAIERSCKFHLRTTHYILADLFNSADRSTYIACELTCPASLRQDY